MPRPSQKNSGDVHDIRLPQGVNEIVVTPRFKLVFYAVLSLTVTSLLLNVFLVILNMPSEQSRALIDTCSTTFKLGFGAIVGLIGSKLTD